MTHWLTGLSIAQRTGIVYGALLAGWLFGLELPARFGWIPILTLSGDITAAIKWWHVLGFELAAFMVVLFGHFDNGWKVEWVIASAAAIAASVAVHLQGAF